MSKETSKNEQSVAVPAHLEHLTKAIDFRAQAVSAGLPTSEGIRATAAAVGVSIIAMCREQSLTDLHIAALEAEAIRIIQDVTRLNIRIQREHDDQEAKKLEAAKIAAKQKADADFDAMTDESKV